MHFIQSRMPLWLLRIFSPKKAIEVQIARITTRLIRKTFGPFGKVTRTFKKSLKCYDAESTPISTEEATQLLVSMVKLAVAQRSLLPALITEQANRKMFSNRMDRKLQHVVDLAIDTDKAYRSAEFIREDYLIEYAHFSQNRLQSFRHQGTVPLSDYDLDRLEAQLKKMDSLTGLGGNKL